MAEQVSIIIPAHNEENYIQETIESVLRIDHDNIEVIVVCNGCTDRTGQVLRRYDSVKLVNLGKAGVAAAKNMGVKESAGKYLLFLDADTSVSPNIIKELLRNYDGNTSVSTCKIKPDTMSIKAMLITGIKNMALGAGLCRTSNGHIFCSREVFDRLGGFDVRMHKHEDGHFVRSAAKKFGRFRFVKEAHAITSMRRFEKLGYMNAIWYWVDDWLKNNIGMDAGEEYPPVR